MSIKESISADMKEAMKARDQLRLDCLRSVLSAFTYKKTEIGRELTQEEELAVVQKQVKQRNDSIAQFGKAGRQELVDKETAERDILEKYLPARKSEAEIREIIKNIIDGLKPEERNQGAVMKIVMPQLKDVADGNLVRLVVNESLKG